MYSFPLILPMPGSLNRVIDCNSPWVSTDPVLLRECLAVYRSVRLVLLALIAFVSGPRRIQAEEANSESQWLVATAHLETNEIRGSGLRRQSSAFNESVLARKDHFTSPVSPAPGDTNVNCGAGALALDSPKLPSLSREATRAHAPPLSLILKNFDASKLDRKITILQPAAHSATTLLSAIHQAQIFAQLVAHPPSMRNGSVVAILLYPPKRKSLHLDVIRAHAPPVQGSSIDSNGFPFDFSNAVAASVDFNLFVTPQSVPLHDSAPAPVANPTSSNLIISILQSPHSYHRPALQLFCRPFSIPCHRKLPESANFRAVSLLVSTQPNRLKGGHIYVRQ
jgi:hypothetical protein